MTIVAGTFHEIDNDNRARAVLVDCNLDDLDRCPFARRGLCMHGREMSKELCFYGGIIYRESANTSKSKLFHEQRAALKSEVDGLPLKRFAPFHHMVIIGDYIWLPYDGMDNSFNRAIPWVGKKPRELNFMTFVNLEDFTLETVEKLVRFHPPFHRTYHLSVAAFLYDLRFALPDLYNALLAKDATVEPEQVYRRDLPAWRSGVEVVGDDGFTTHIGNYEGWAIDSQTRLRPFADRVARPGHYANTGVDIDLIDDGMQITFLGGGNINAVLVVRDGVRGARMLLPAESLWRIEKFVATKDVEVEFEIKPGTKVMIDTNSEVFVALFEQGNFYPYLGW